MRDLDLSLNEKVFSINSGTYEFLLWRDVLYFKYMPFKYPCLDKSRIKNTKLELETLKHFTVFCFTLTKVSETVNLV